MRERGGAHADCVGPRRLCGTAAPVWGQGGAPASGADPLAPLAAALGGVVTRGDLPALYALACDTVPGARPGVAWACARGGGAAPLAQT